MTAATPTPLERLLHLETSLDQLQLQLAQPRPKLEANDHPLPARQPWPVDELLLIRLLRRTPAALAAYQAPAELSSTSQRGLRLTTSQTGSPFQFCELNHGGAVVWITADSPSWIWGSETFQQLFSVPSGVEASPDLVVQSLPVFNPVVRGTTWSLFRRGEMVPRHRLSPENEQQGMLLRRIETLERRLSQQMIRQDSEINELKTQLHIQQNVLDRLLRITETRQPDSSG